MRRHLNTIYVTSEGAYCRKDGANIVVEVEGQERGRAPIHVMGAWSVWVALLSLHR